MGFKFWVSSIREAARPQEHSDLIYIYIHIYGLFGAPVRRSEMQDPDVPVIRQSYRSALRIAEL